MACVTRKYFHKNLRVPRANVSSDMGGSLSKHPPGDEFADEGDVKVGDCVGGTSVGNGQRPDGKGVVRGDATDPTDADKSSSWSLASSFDYHCMRVWRSSWIACWSPDAEYHTLKPPKHSDYRDKLPEPIEFKVDVRWISFTLLMSPILAFSASTSDVFYFMDSPGVRSLHDARPVDVRTARHVVPEIQGGKAFGARTLLG